MGDTEESEILNSPEEMITIINSLYDTFVKYLAPDAILNNSVFFEKWKNERTSTESSRETMVKELLESVVENEDAARQFTETLQQLCDNSVAGNSFHPAICAGTDDEKLRMTYYMEHLTKMIDGSLLKKLSYTDITTVLDSLLERKVITERVYKEAREIENPYASCMKMLSSLKRGKPEWPCVFFDAVSQSQKKQNLVSLQNRQNEIVPAPQSASSLPAAVDDSDQAMNETGHTHLSDTVQDSGNTPLSEFLKSDDYSHLSSDLYSDNSKKYEKSMFHLTKGESEELGWQILKETGNVDPKRIIIDPANNDDGKRYLDERMKDFSDDDDNLSDDQEDNQKDEQETPELSLRNYQIELAENALKGWNTIVCAPTGSGKTRVATYIILNHLQSREDCESKRKVAFLARTVPLVMQQCKSLQKYLPKSFEVTYLTGESEDSMHLHMILEDNDIIVMTPRILENHLIRKCITDLGVFSMLVFDECHHTRKGEPYNTLMYSYLKTKRNDSNVKLPQIIGLTASISVEKAVQDQEAVKCILQILGNLDADNISCVEKYEKELAKLVPVPEEEMKKLKERDTVEKNEAVEKIKSIMRKLEKYAVDHGKEIDKPDLHAFLGKIPSDKKSQQYGQWAVKMRNIAKAMPLEEFRETNVSVRSLIVISDYLVAYNEALELYDLVRLEDVMAYLERSLRKYHNYRQSTNLEATYFSFFEELQNLMKPRLDEENPNLMILKDTLLKYLTEERSCGIIFVRTRALTNAVKSWLNKCGDEKLMKLKATVFTGTGASVEQGGMTTAEQDEVIRKFKSGEVRLLVATSVGEEGIDIPECNLVIKYNHVGNEVTTVQTRGRSRRQGGMSVLLAMDKILRKERINQEKAKMMIRAIKEIKNMKRSKIQKLNKEHQEKIMKDEAISEIVHQQEQNRLLKEPFRMVCHLCRKLIIDSDKIKTIFGTHRVVVDREILSKTRTLPYKEDKYFDELKIIGTVRCKAEPEEGKFCNAKLGSLMIFSKVPFIVLGIKYFGFDTNNSIGLEYYNQWKKVPYAIDEIAPADFERYLPEKKQLGKESEEEDNESDDSGGDDDSKSNKPSCEGNSIDKSQGTQSSSQEEMSTQQNLPDSITELKKRLEITGSEYGRDVNGTSVTLPKQLPGSQGAGTSYADSGYLGSHGHNTTNPKALMIESQMNSKYMKGAAGVASARLPKGSLVLPSNLSLLKSNESQTPVMSSKEVAAAIFQRAHFTLNREIKREFDTFSVMSSKISSFQPPKSTAEDASLSIQCSASSMSSNPEMSSTVTEASTNESNEPGRPTSDVTEKTKNEEPDRSEAIQESTMPKSMSVNLQKDAGRASEDRDNSIQENTEPKRMSVNPQNDGGEASEGSSPRNTSRSSQSMNSGLNLL